MRQYPILILTLAFTFQVTAQNIRTTAFESILNRGAVLNLSPIGRDLEKKGNGRRVSQKTPGKAVFDYYIQPLLY